MLNSLPWVRLVSCYDHQIEVLKKSTSVSKGHTHASLAVISLRKCFRQHLPHELSTPSHLPTRQPLHHTCPSSIATMRFPIIHERAAETSTSLYTTSSPVSRLSRLYHYAASLRNIARPLHDVVPGYPTIAAREDASAESISTERDASREDLAAGEDLAAREDVRAEEDI